MEQKTQTEIPCKNGNHVRKTILFQENSEQVFIRCRCRNSAISLTSLLITLTLENLWAQGFYPI